jgi:membrane protease YdiL (CAAX protease family)
MILIIKNNKKAFLFITLTFLISYLLGSLYFLFGGKWAVPGSLIVSIVYMFIPMTVTIFVQKIVFHNFIKEPLGVSFKINRWFLIAWLIPVIISFLTLGIDLLFPMVEFTPNMAGFFEKLKNTLTLEQIEIMRAQAVAFPIHPYWIQLIQALIAGITVNALAGFGEELGWRGLLQREFAYLGFWKSSLLIGIIWGIWHAPIILQGHNYPQHPKIGVFMMIIFTLLLAPIFSYVRLKAKSVIAAAIIHGTLNATFALDLMVIKGGNGLTVGISGLAGFIALVFVNIGLFSYDHYFASDKIMTNKPIKI